MERASKWLPPHIQTLPCRPLAGLALRVPVGLPESLFAGSWPVPVTLMVVSVAAGLWVCFSHAGMTVCG